MKDALLFFFHPIEQPNRIQPRPSRPGSTRWPWTGSSDTSASRSSGRATSTKTPRTRRRAGGTLTSTGPGSPGRWSCIQINTPSCWWQVSTAQGCDGGGTELKTEVRRESWRTERWRDGSINKWRDKNEERRHRRDDEMEEQINGWRERGSNVMNWCFHKEVNGHNYR